MGELPLDQQPNVTLSTNYAGRELVWHGKIVRTEAQIDTASRMVHVIARVTNDAQTAPLSVGLFVNAEIEGLLVDDVVVLPRNALRNGNRVLVLDSANKLRYRDVTPLRLHQDQVLIQSGLQAGERVCISPMQTAIDGMTVKPLAADTQTTAG
jgi:multidrug efflux pump subunit AcrA (membrane-fusion protein)